MSYPHLTYTERYQIEQCLREGLPMAAIARRLGRHRSALYRELARGQRRSGYDAVVAEERAGKRARLSAANHPTKSPALWTEVAACLRASDSPEQIEGRMKRLKQTVRVSAVAIYDYVLRDAKAGGQLHSALWRAHRPGRRPSARGLPKGRPSIRGRPKPIAKRRRLGHWEVDTVGG